MTVCRYFLKGSCRFGDRCRFEHPQNDHQSYNQRNAGNYQEQYGRQESGYSNYRRDTTKSAGNFQDRYGRQESAYSNYRSDSEQRNQRYESGNYYDDSRNYYSGQRQENRYHSPMRSGGYDDHQQYQYKQNYDYQSRYDERNYGRNKQYSSNNYRENDNVHSQNRYQWLSEDYKRQNQPQVEYANNNYPQDSYRTSTPKGTVPFSFKIPESEIKKDSSSYVKINEKDQLYVNLVKEDAKSWELGGQWPFSCYFPSNSKHGFPGFYDVSPEELRYAAYNAEKENSYDSYVQSVQNALVEVNQQISQLQVSTPQLLNTLRKIRDGEDLYSASKKINPLPSAPSSDTLLETMETTAIASTPVKSAAAAFSFKMPTETDSSVKTSAASFSFKLPATTEIKAVPAAVSDGDVDIYTPMGDLTDDEKEQFCASTFVLGKIPTRPPPQGLCS